MRKQDAIDLLADAVLHSTLPADEIFLHFSSPIVNAPSASSISSSSPTPFAIAGLDSEIGLPLG